ncbi:MAG: hypothetical protein DCC65_05620 [Planctomycetota bacterium]|nr:MAG: hypothetical protein DCC65_05620 [Planctomycetota bacterium]
MRRASVWIPAILVIAVFVWLEVRRAPAVFTDAGVLFIDPDDYMRLHRARAILEGGTWHIEEMPDIDWPRGGRLHWTSPMDWLLVGAARGIGTLSAEFDRLDFAAAWLPVGLGVIYLSVVMWLLARSVGPWPALLVGLFAAVSPALHRPFALGHPDHHCLLELLYSVAALVCLPRRDESGARHPPSRRAVVCGGAAMGLAVWVAPQSMAAWLAILCGATWATLSGPPEERAVWALRRFDWSLAVLAVVLLGFGVENGPNIGAVSADRISLLHVALAALAMLLPLGPSASFPKRADQQSRRGAAVPAGAWEGRPPAMPRSLGGWVLFGAAALALVVWVAARHRSIFFTVGREEFFRWSEHIVELQPLWTRAGGRVSLAQMHLHLGLLPYALPVALWIFLRGPSLPAGPRVMLALLAAGFTALAIVQRRWLDHAILGLAPVIVIAAWELAGRMLMARNADAPGRRLLLAGVICLALLSPATGFALSPPPAQAHPLDLRSALVAARIREYEAKRPSPPDRRGILCDDAEGSMLLYRTRLPVVAAPYHRTVDGIVEAARFYAERDDEAAREQLARLRVRYVVVPFRPHEQLMNFERIAFKDLRSYDPPVESIDAIGMKHQELRYRPEITRTMAYRLAMEPNARPAGLECIAVIKEGAQTPDGYSGLVYVVPEAAAASAPADD